MADRAILDESVSYLNGLVISGGYKTGFVVSAVRNASNAVCCSSVQTSLSGLAPFNCSVTVSYTHLTLPTNREV